MDLSLFLMEPSIKENYLMASKMAMELKYGKMALNTKVNGEMIRQMVMVN